MFVTDLARCADDALLTSVYFWVNNICASGHSERLQLVNGEVGLSLDSVT